MEISETSHDDDDEENSLFVLAFKNMFGSVQSTPVLFAKILSTIWADVNAVQIGFRKNRTISGARKQVNHRIPKHVKAKLRKIRNSQCKPCM